MVQLGKRYKCNTCNTEVLCTKPSDCDPNCCGGEMELQKPKKKPSSD